jgi:hypothetical protein
LKLSLPYEDDLAASSGSSDWEDSVSGVDLPVLKVTLAKVVCGSSQAKSDQNSSPAKSLLRRGFLGSRVPSTPLVPTPASALFALPDLKGPIPLFDGASELGKEISQSSTSSVSKSQWGYYWRVKEKVAKQLNKNKELLAKAVAITPGVGVEGYSKEVLNCGEMSWGGDDKKLLDMLSTRDKEQKVKGMRELKNLDCSFSLVKAQCRRRVGGPKNDISFLPKIH